MSNVVLQAVLDKITTLKDGGVKLIFDSQEITKEQGADLMGLRNKMGYLFFGDSHDGKIDTSHNQHLPFQPEKINGKSASQHLRAAIYREWEAFHSQESDSETYYQQRMRQIIGSIVEKLPSPFRE